VQGSWRLPCFVVIGVIRMESFNLEDDDVIKLNSSENPTLTTTSTHNEVMQSIFWAVSSHLKARGVKDVGTFGRIFYRGVKGDVLRPGEGWLTGTVRVRLEFIPDEPEEEDEQEAVLLRPAKPESPLDDLRAELNLNKE
jgi:hypothetical protein